MASWSDVRRTRCCSRLGCNRHYMTSSASLSAALDVRRGRKTIPAGAGTTNGGKQNTLQQAVRAGITECRTAGCLRPSSGVGHVTCCSACGHGVHGHTTHCDREHRRRAMYTEGVQAPQMQSPPLTFSSPLLSMSSTPASALLVSTRALPSDFTDGAAGKHGWLRTCSRC